MDEKEKQQALEEEQARLQALKVGYSLSHDALWINIFLLLVKFEL